MNILAKSTMLIQLSILHFIFLLLPPAFSNLVSKPGCLDHCGTLSIPYPFGVGPGCSREPSFDIFCNISTSPAKAYLTAIGNEVVEINETYVRVKYPNLISVCYDSSDYGDSSGTIMRSNSVNLTGTLYQLSAFNRLTVLGCDDMAMGFMQPNGSLVTGSCSAVCPDRSDADESIGYCSYDTAYLSYGCCQISAFGDTGFFGAQLSNLAGKLSRPRLFPCSYAFIQDLAADSNDTEFFYPLYYLHNSTAMLNDNWASTSRPPVVKLDWKLVPENCSQARLEMATYACVDKSVCIDGAESNDLFVYRGYTCKCVEGYEGNPYLPGGCKPISISSSIAKPGCLDQCGRLLIPFPFGVGEKCYYAPPFNIHCNISTNPPKAYLVTLNAEIIQLNSSRVSVYYRKYGFASYDFSDYNRGITKIKERSLIIDLSNTQYTLSEGNWVTTVGCDNMVVERSRRGNRSFIGVGCASVCLEDSRDYGICRSDGTNDGCCRAAVPRGTTYLEANLTIISVRRPPSNFSCSYTNFEHINEFQYSYPILKNLSSISTDVPPNYLFRSSDWQQKGLALDWRIGAVSCEEAQSNPATFACKSNSYCVDFDPTLGGYLCNCSKGFHGNPYLTSGCKDIDECAKNNTCDSSSKCINTQGSYYCSCPEGYAGNGRGCIRLPPSKSKMMILKGVGSGLGCLLLILMFFRMSKLSLKRREKILKERFFRRNGGLLLKQQTGESTLGKTNVFTAKELEVATDNFNESRIIGQGGQGTVYKGMLSDGRIVAVKRSKLVEEQHLEQFINEVVILSQINHRNIVKLLGFCLETEVPLLVYEFMPNGTLFDLIHHPNKEFPLPWTMRLKIAADLAGALAYLHSACSIPIFHRDIKSNNILLDEKNIVKVSDFGTSMSVAVDMTHLTTMVKGTFGYLDPEYFRSSQFTEKSDVYSFGVVLVELLTGKRPISNDDTDEERGLAMRFLTSMEENCLDTILDPLVLEESKKEEMVLAARLAQRCLNLQGRMRPTMKEVATELESLRITQMPSSSEKDDVEEISVFERMPSTFLDDGYTWSASYNNVSSTPLASQPLMMETKYS